ncbi:MAG: hypothetical protein B6U86_06120 [Candidatus Altiarchaeales archaeon ex4484_43]|nr:MAG: hypothetical protein B6U86_06120 [Candidatus Altiarchaeales archaeon ex4484_43]
MGAYGNTNYASKSTGTVNTAPPSPQVSISPSSPTQNDNLTCNIDNQPPDPDGDNITYIYKWYKNTLLQDDLTNSTVPSSYVEEGDLWQCEVMANDGSLNSVPATAEVRVQGNISRPDYQGLKTQYCWLQAQIDALPLEGGVVNIPEGEHTIAITFIDRSNITLQGQGPDKTILKPYAESGGMIEVGNNLEAVSNTTIKDLTLTAGDTMNRNIRSIYLHSSVSDFCTNSRIENVTVKNCGGVFFVRASSTVITDSEFYSTEASIFPLFSKGTTVTYCKFNDSKYWWAIDFQSEKNGTISHCEFYSCGSGAIKLYSGASNSIISDNLIDSASFHAPIGIFGASGSIIERNIVRNSVGIGAVIVGYPYRNDNVIIRNNLIYSNEQAGIEFKYNRNKYLDSVLVESNTIYGNGGDGILIGPDNYYIVTARNNIIADNGGYGIRRESTTLNLSYNDVWNNTNDSYYNVSSGIGDISEDPLFADPDNGDFHLKSEAGRWNGTDWVKDDVTSPCIDAGDPNSAYSNEPEPNGDRINMGSYGNTEEASKSPDTSTTTTTTTTTTTIPYRGGGGGGGGGSYGARPKPSCFDGYNYNNDNYHNNTCR